MTEETLPTHPPARTADDRRAAQFRLLIYRDSSVKTLVLEGDRWVVGRAEDCEIRIDDVTASRHHLVLERNEAGIRFRDLGGTNVTLLNGRPAREGALELGSTLLVGMTRLTLDALKAQARVRVIADSRQTAVIFRHYLDTKAAARPIVGPGASTAHIAIAVTRLLEKLAAPTSELGDVEEVAATLLDAALDQTGRQAGVIGKFDPMGPMKVLASIHRGPDGSELCIPRQVLQEARTRSAPFLLEPGVANAGTRERIVVPLGELPSGLLMLEGPDAAAPSGQTALHLATAFGHLLWKCLEETQERSNLRQEVSRLRFSRSAASAAVLGSARLQPVRRKLSEAARHELPVLLIGEEGTEKEDLARYLHSQSAAAAGPFVAFYVSVLPAQRVEEELFGPSHAADDVQQGPPTGCLLRARGGTLFVDQPERMPCHVQERLAWVLQNRGIDLPGQERPVPVDLRVVVAMHEPDEDGPGRPLAQHLQEYFTGGVRLTIPPLREHPDDIASMAELILSEMGPGSDGGPRTLTDSAARTLLSYAWPGNTRQLRRALETAATRAGPGPIAPRHLPPEVRDPEAASAPHLPTLADMERRHILQTLSVVGGNKRQAASSLGIATSTLYEKLRRYKIDI